MVINRRMRRNRRNRRNFAGGFTLIEALVAVVLVAIGIVGVFGGIRALTAAQIRAANADLLQRLATWKMSELSSTVTDPTTADTSGDFSDQGYPNITWSADVEQENATNIDKVTVTTTLNTNDNSSANGYTQSVSTLFYVPTQTGTTPGATGSGQQ